MIIDRGTPAGFQVVADAREQLLKLGRKPILPESSSVEAAEESEEDPEVLMIGGLKFTAVRQESVGPQNGEGEALPTVGSHIIAPVRLPVLWDARCHIRLANAFASVLMTDNALFTVREISATSPSGSNVPPSFG